MEKLLLRLAGAAFCAGIGYIIPGALDDTNGAAKLLTAVQLKRMNRSSAGFGTSMVAGGIGALTAKTWPRRLGCGVLALAGAFGFGANLSEVSIRQENNQAQRKAA